MSKTDLSLRDWFAGQALMGLLAGENAPKKSKTEAADQYAVRVAEEAYLFADGMLHVRERTSTHPGEAAPGPKSAGAAAKPRGTVRISGNWRNPNQMEWAGTAAVSDGRIERSLDIPQEAYQAIEEALTGGSNEGTVYVRDNVRFDWFLDQ